VEDVWLVFLVSCKARLISNSSLDMRPFLCGCFWMVDGVGDEKDPVVVVVVFVAVVEEESETLSFSGVVRVMLDSTEEIWSSSIRGVSVLVVVVVVVLLLRGDRGGGDR